MSSKVAKVIFKNGLVLNFLSRKVEEGGSPLEIRFTRKEWKVLECLCLNIDIICSADKITDYYDSDSVGDPVSGIRNCIGEVRKKDNRFRQLIKTINGAGYMIPRQNIERIIYDEYDQKEEGRSDFNDFADVVEIEPIIASGISENGEYLSSYLFVDESHKSIDYYYNLSKKNQNERLANFVMLLIDPRVLMLSSKVDIESYEYDFCFEYENKSEYQNIGRVTLEFKYSDSKLKFYESHFEIDSVGGKIRVRMPKLNKNIYDRFSEICLVFWPSGLKVLAGNIVFKNLRFERG